MTDSQDDQGATLSSPAGVVGARLIVDVLRQLAGTPPDTVQLTPMRNKAAQFVLEKSLQKIEHQVVTLTYPVPLIGLASSLHQFARNEKKILYMAQADWGAVKLIDLVFDAVIDQGKLDAEAIWLLNRFRLPIFHAVLSDYSFFFARQNLARRFINAVTLHLLTTREPFARELKFVLGGIAARMHEAFDTGPGKFNALCVEGQTWFATQQQRLQKAELKVREMAETKSRKQQAEERVVTLLNRCIGGRVLPQMLIEFLVGDWRQLLLLTSMKEGEQGINWKRQSRLTESMVEFVQGCQTPEGRAQYQKFLPSLVKGLQGALADITDNKQRVSRILDPVELVLNALVLGAMPDSCEHAGLPLPETRAASFEVTLESSPAAERIQALQPGQWVRFRTQDRQYEACSLVVKGIGAEPWSFVNQSGQGVVSKSVSQLAALLTSGILEIVGEGNAIDEVMNRFIADTAAVLSRVPVPAQTRTARRPLDVRQAAEGRSGVAFANNEGLSAGAPAAIGEGQSAATAVDAPASGVAAPVVQTSPELNSPEPSVPDMSTPELAALENALSRSEAALAAPTETADQDFPEEVMQASYAAVDGLQIGARLVWYKSEQEDVSLKLAVKIRSTDKLVFVNHVGIKTLDTDRRGLARLIASGRVAIIDIGVKFDSALERIVKHIQQDKK